MPATPAATFFTTFIPFSFASSDTLVLFAWISAVIIAQSLLWSWGWTTAIGWAFYRRTRLPLPPRRQQTKIRILRFLSPRLPRR
jgi:hypothetical protein